MTGLPNDSREPPMLLEYRSAHSDRRSMLERLDGPFVRAALFLIAVPIGLLIHLILCLALIFVTVDYRRELIWLVLPALCLAIVPIWIGSNRFSTLQERRWVFFVQGLLCGAMLVEGVVLIASVGIGLWLLVQSVAGI